MIVPSWLSPVFQLMSATVPVNRCWGSILKAPSSMADLSKMSKTKWGSSGVWGHFIRTHGSENAETVGSAAIVNKCTHQMFLAIQTLWLAGTWNSLCWRGTFRTFVNTLRTNHCQAVGTWNKHKMTQRPSYKDLLRQALPILKSFKCLVRLQKNVHDKIVCKLL